LFKDFNNLKVVKNLKHIIYIIMLGPEI